MALYAFELHSARASERMRASTGVVALTPLHELEMINAFELWLFRREATRSTAQHAWAEFERDRMEGVFVVQEIPAKMFPRAARLARDQPAEVGTRALDLLHVASALELGADAFFSFDVRQCKAARAAGLRILG